MWLIFRAEKELAAMLNDSQRDQNVDIDQTLNDKAMKNQLTTRNVKNLIKVPIYQLRYNHK